jgi:hypothetical protein
MSTNVQGTRDSIIKSSSCDDIYDNMDRRSLCGGGNADCDNMEIGKEDRYNTNSADLKKVGDPIIYRYNFSNDFNLNLYEFSKIHQYDDRKQFREAWNVWKDDNQEIIEQEVTRLSELKYSGDIMDKMFKSARYYFRKKSTVRPEPKERRSYQSVQKMLLETMDRYINDNRTIRPSDSFVEFCENHKEDLREEVIHLVECGLEQAEIINKIKKTYKNRYFILVTK